MNNLTKRELRDFKLKFLPTFENWLKNIACDRSVMQVNTLERKFAGDFPECPLSFGMIFQYWRSKKRGHYDLRDGVLTLNKRKEAPSQFKHRLNRSIIRRQSKMIQESHQEYKEERTKWFSDRFEETGKCPEMSEWLQHCHELKNPKPKPRQRYNIY